MNLSLVFTRIFFAIISICLITAYSVTNAAGPFARDFFVGVIGGCIFSLCLFGFDILFRRFNLRSFNIAIIGIFIGYLMGEGLVLVFDAILQISTSSFVLSVNTIEISKIILFLFGIYLGTMMILRSADELYVSIPFVKFSPTAQKKKDLLLDLSVLADTRIIDLCSTGIFDHSIIIPRFIMKELYSQAESLDEHAKNKAKRALDTLKKLEGIPNLHLRYNDTDFPDVRDSTSKLIRLARLIDSNILTADISRVQIASIEGVKVINMHSLSNALKPLMQTGEYIKIKVQRFGKEPNQGVGYLEDGTMVVINGGGDYIGQAIEVQVLSVKHTSSGRMIFCNALDYEYKEGDFSGYEDEEQ
ncbi:MAG: TRAM domain-containing protein [Chlamydiales bacterium]|nr:TRAM domain-containing protein [Chlamydiales bacterium]